VWRLAEATSSSRGLQWFTRKPLGYSVEPQNQGRRLHKEVRPPRPVQPPRRDGQTARACQIAGAGLTTLGGGLTALVVVPRCFEAKATRRDRKACVEAKQVLVAGHPSDEENLKTSKFALEGLVSLVIK
jgi:hypothetical protein